MAEVKIGTVFPDNSIRRLGYPRKMESTIYVENSNNMSSLEDVQFVNDTRIAFSSPAFGALNTFRLSRNYHFLGACFVTFNLNMRDAANVATAVGYDYTAYNMIDTIKWTVGGTELLRIDGNSIVPLVLEQCESEAKKSRILELSGYRCTNQITRQVSAFLPLPWSSLNAKKFGSLKPFPLHLLDEPVELQIQLRQAGDCFGTAVPQFTATLCFEYGKIADVSQLKKSVYKYPFSSYFSHLYPITDAASQSIDLLSFRKGELRELKVHAFQGFTTRNEGFKLNNIELLFNGQKIWSSLDRTDGMWELIYNEKPCKFAKRRVIMRGPTGAGYTSQFVHELIDNTTGESSYSGEQLPANSQYIVECEPVTRNGANDEVITLPVRGYYYNIPLGEILDKHLGQGYVIGTDCSKQALTLRFNKEATAGTLVVTHVYTGCYVFDGSSALLAY